MRSADAPSFGEAARRRRVQRRPARRVRGQPRPPPGRSGGRTRSGRPRRGSRRRELVGRSRPRRVPRARRGSRVATEGRPRPARPPRVRQLAVESRTGALAAARPSRETARWSEACDAGTGRRSGRAAPRRCWSSSRTRNGTPPVTAWTRSRRPGRQLGAEARSRSARPPPRWLSGVSARTSADGSAASAREHRRAVGRPGWPRRGDDARSAAPAAAARGSAGSAARPGQPSGRRRREQQRRSPAKVRGQPVEPVQDRERGVEQRVGGVIPRRRETEQPRRVPGRAGQELGPFRRRRRDQQGLEQLADEAIREVSFEFRTARGQRCQAKLAAMPFGRQDQARLADATGPSITSSEPSPAIASRRD